MARKRITMQDIAQACGLSRNTVSKVFNDRGAVSSTTGAPFRRRPEGWCWTRPGSWATPSCLRSRARAGASPC